MQTIPPPIGLTASASIFALFSILLWLTVRAVIPWLRDTFGVLPIIGWYISGTAFVLVPILLYGCAMAWRELPEHSPGALKKRLRLHSMDRGDVIWVIGGLLAITTASAVILALARYLNPNFRPSPWFLQHAPGLHVWVFAAWIPLFVSNILVRNSAGAVTFCLARRKDSAELHGCQMEFCGACFTGVSAGRLC